MSEHTQTNQVFFSTPQFCQQFPIFSFFILFAYRMCREKLSLHHSKWVDAKTLAPSKSLRTFWLLILRRLATKLVKISHWNFASFFFSLRGMPWTWFFRIKNKKAGHRVRFSLKYGQRNKKQMWRKKRGSPNWLQTYTAFVLKNVIAGTGYIEVQYTIKSALANRWSARVTCTAQNPAVQRQGRAHQAVTIHRYDHVDASPAWILLLPASLLN